MIRRILAILTASLLTVSFAAQGMQTASTTMPAGAIVTTQPVAGWFAPVQAHRQQHALPAAPTRVFIVPIREEISPKTYDALKRKVLRAKAAGAEIILLDMDTFGGEIHAALNISRLLKADLDSIYTVCLIRTRAISAGALIALACDEIVMTPVGTLGDAAPISMAGTLEGIEREKIETVLRNEFVDSAQRNGYSPALAECMVSAKREAWLVQHKQTGELRYVLAHEFRGQVDAPPGVTSAPANPAGEWKHIRTVVPEGDLLTLNTTQAKEYGFTRHVVDAPADQPYAKVLERFHVTTPPQLLADTWSEKLVEFLTTPAVAGFLLFVGVLCMYVEINTPGFGIPGAVAIFCFAVLFGSRYLTGMAQWWEIALFILGLLLLLLEVFVIPGFGVAGVLGILFMATSLAAVLVANAPDRLPIPQTELDWTLLRQGLLAFAGGFILAAVAAALLTRYLPKAPIAGKVILTPAAAFSGEPASDLAPQQRIVPGDKGVTETVCRPVGKVRFGSDLLDAMSEGERIDRGQHVRVLRREGNMIIIERIA